MDKLLDPLKREFRNYQWNDRLKQLIWSFNCVGNSGSKMRKNVCGCTQNITILSVNSFFNWVIHNQSVICCHWNDITKAILKWFPRFVFASLSMMLCGLHARPYWRIRSRKFITDSKSHTNGIANMFSNNIITNETITRRVFNCVDTKIQEHWCSQNQ